MTKKEQIAFVKVMMKSNTDFMIKKIRQGSVPDNWDGFEFRHWLNKIAEYENIWADKFKKKSWRKRINDCNNTMIVNNLY